ncbi:pyruvate dehydrogenase E1 component alpha subunit [Rhodopseudomonas thermotolerans]|uniref:Pyruvate dehydrogenase E1 component alpha subunit n=2 Tax=Rhodopseudomonas TaxID=1073 RepID=A0A336JKE9_9BRAD|nr:MULTISPECIES: thiamine pyrophosphate-dependent dehydrogenase E1 component subunit alpha [Rhodopseudomonas]RED38120.1 pyruvate dehydrogenase E1 component alpha subunit [Rhodopseudomonas pentothenatexigens]REG05313.1 pyruvate dehydrogenase E1 component alpha subunit [Rhodopseudomonas thermotolerans]SSW90145.1 pyruvate dehydrogenase E1 component alpha subunit [Rhodopseudomonas pentothenatexigens]
MNPETSRRLLFDMLRIRSVEETIAARYGEQKMRCPTHLSVGQEAVAAAAGAVLRPTDLAVSGHRAHAHYLAKGGSLKAMIAEIYGKVTGCARGKGGSMHLIDESVGFMGSTAIVGGTVPVGVGLSYPMKLNSTDQISCVFLGDAVPETGVFFESVNFAVVKQLPVLFLCENNGYSVYSPLRVRQPPGRKLHELVAGFGLETHHGDGNDARAVVAALSEGVAAIRAGEGPRFYEFETYRWREHCGPNYDNDIGYRSAAEYEAWKLRDPVPALQRALITEAIVTEADVADMQAEIDAEIEEAFAFAESSPFPPPEDAFTDVYASTAG